MNFLKIRYISEGHRKITIITGKRSKFQVSSYCISLQLMKFRDMNILLGVTGSIAAYKIAFLVRLFIKAGANVKIIMTTAATEFITPLTLSVLSKNPVLIDFTSKSASPAKSAESAAWNNHV